MMANQRERLPNRRIGETFELELAGLRYTETVSRFPDEQLGELFLSNHKSNSAADTNAQDSAIVCSIALQCGADVDSSVKQLSRDSHASGLLDVVLDRLADHKSPDDKIPF